MVLGRATKGRQGRRQRTSGQFTNQNVQGRSDQELSLKEGAKGRRDVYLEIKSLTNFVESRREKKPESPQ